MIFLFFPGSFETTPSVMWPQGGAPLLTTGPVLVGGGSVPSYTRGIRGGGERKDGPTVAGVR